MTAVSTFPSPREIASLLARSPEPSRPALDLKSLETYYADWPYPKSLDYWEGFIYADLCEQAGWGFFKHEEYSAALEAWSHCPWPSANQGEKQAIAQILQTAYEEQTLILAPPVGDLLSHDRVPLGAVLATLDDPVATLGRASSGVGYVVESRLVRPEGIHHLRFEFSEEALFYISFLPAEVHHKLMIARTHYQMGDLEEAGSWLLRAAFHAANSGLKPEAYSFLEKALQMNPHSEPVQKSLTNMQVQGVGPTLFSRVLVERTLFQPDPVKRCEIRPEQPPEPEPTWLEYDWKSALGYPIRASETHGKIVSLGTMPLEKAREISFMLADDGEAWPLLFPSSWKCPQSLDLDRAEKSLSRVRAMGLEKLGLWKLDYRPVLNEMLESWPEPNEMIGGPEVLDFALPNEVQLLVFGCAELWQIPTLLPLDVPELETVEVLAAWWRRLNRNWGARPFLVAEDVIWFFLYEVPEEERQELFLADLMTFSSDVAECFEPSMIRSAGPGKPYLFPLPLQLTLRS